jgi:hypothetical protein
VVPIYASTHSQASSYSAVRSSCDEDSFGLDIDIPYGHGDNNGSADFLESYHDELAAERIELARKRTKEWKE